MGREGGGGDVTVRLRVKTEVGRKGKFVGKKSLREGGEGKS